ncbi:MAG: hypothetical protein M3Q52_07050 [Pseudomonadota bacterium]|nr:hypothetical protein [Pseudomonadota bacterium]
MRKLLLLFAVLGLAACEDGGTSAAEMEAAALDKVRQELRLAADAPLQTKVWVGAQEHEGETVLCGTASDSTPGTTVPPKRFAATGDPIRWLIFEDAYNPMIRTQGDKFPEWRRLCAGNEAAG